MDEIIDIDDLFEDAEVDPPAPEEPVDMPVATEEAPPVMVADIDDLFTE